MRWSCGRAGTVAGVLVALAAAAPLRGQPAWTALPRAYPSLPRAVDGEPPPALDVPFVPQGELLCGGAAAAMVLRYHGERGVSARSFAHLVRPEEGGIRTDELAAELVRRGWSAGTAAGDLAALETALFERLPPVALLEWSPGRWHYVVVVAVERDATTVVRVHDPARAPDQRLELADFLRRWDGGRRWMMVVRPRAAERTAPAVGESPPPGRAATPALLTASERFRALDWEGAAAAARDATRAAPTDGRGWRLLGTSLYLAGRADEALGAWARVGEPTVDGVRVTGLARTRHPVAHDLIGLEAGERLDRDGLERARRRASLLPTAALTRVGYRPSAGGWVEIDAVAIEGPAHPFTRQGALWAALAAASGELTAWSSGLAGAGERLEARFRPGADGGVRLELAAPGALGLPGRTELGVARVDELDHTAAWLRASDWATGWLRWEAGARADRWLGGFLRPGLTGVVHLAAPGGPLEARIGGALWSGGSALGAADATLQLGRPSERWTGVLRASARALSAGAPPALRPAAGAGGQRSLPGPFAGPDPVPPLRARPTLRADRLAHAGIEATRWAGAGLRFGLAGFAELALVRDGSSADRHLDAGLGLRATLPGLPGALRLDHGWGTGGARAWSFGWMLWPGAALRP